MGNSMTEPAKHTEGPWHVERGGSKSVCTAVVSADGTVIASDETYYPAALDPKNASLIAAAPDLLDAVRALLLHWDSGNFSREPELWEMMRSAIAKAEGRS